MKFWPILLDEHAGRSAMLFIKKDSKHAYQHLAECCAALAAEDRRYFHFTNMASSIRFDDLDPLNLLQFWLVWDVARELAFAMPKHPSRLALHHWYQVSVCQMGINRRIPNNGPLTRYTPDRKSYAKECQKEILCRTSPR